MAKMKKQTEIKPAVKKSAAVKKSGLKKYLKKVPETMVFWCNDGQIFNDIDQLIIGFDLMSDATFMYHAREDKNDFSCWITDVIGDQELGKDIKKARNKVEAKKIVEQRSYDLSLLED